MMSSATEGYFFPTNRLRSTSFLCRLMIVVKTFLVVLVESFFRDVKFSPVVPGKLPIEWLTEMAVRLQIRQSVCFKSFDDWH